MNEVLVIDNVDLELLEQQRRGLGRLLSLLEGAPPAPRSPHDASEREIREDGLAALTGIVEMLDHWSDRRALT